MKAKKQHRLKTAFSWHRMFPKTAHGKYSLERIKLQTGKSAEAIMATLNADQLQLLISFSAASYSSGCEHTRANFSDWRKLEKDDAQAITA